MLKAGYFFLAVVLFALAACNERPRQKSSENKPVQVPKVEDKHTFALPDQAVMEHLSLNLQVDFEQQRLKGVAEIHFKNRNGSTELFLDTKDLEIKAVKVGDREVPWKLHDKIPHLGSALEVSVDTFTRSVKVFYETSAGAEALQWLSPGQTSGGKHPFLFTQSQAILARSWIPCQDSPGIRFTYDATVTVPRGLLALMSAQNPASKNETGTYTFTQDKPVPAYLMALVAGDITFTSIGKRTGVYAEPGILKEAAYELADLEKMLKAAEKLYGEYLWGRYDVIFLPPAFPFGGMENPMLTFATPTILAGDRSLVSLVAHELAHSWSGNLVTNATWDDFWLNEGFTVYFEYRIMEEIYGKATAEMLALISYADLQEELEAMNYSEDTRLKLNLAGRNPDEGMNSIAYDKGYFFLRLIEETVGRPAWDSFLNKYFKEFAFRSVTTGEFVQYLNQHLLQHHAGAADSINIDKWVYGEGLPRNCPKIQSEKFKAVEQQLTAFASGTSADQLKTSGWAYQQWVHFLRNLPRELTNYQLSTLDTAFGFTSSGNSEILFEWLMLAVKSNYRPAFNRLEDFLVTVGRRKFIAPLYAEMYKNEKLQEMARRIYRNARGNYHFVATSTIDRVLELDGEEI